MMSRFDMETAMKKFLLTAALLAACQPVLAGGPVIVEDAYEATPEQPKRKLGGWVIPVVLGIVVLGALANGSDRPCNDDTDPAPDSGGC